LEAGLSKKIEAFLAEYTTKILPSLQAVSPQDVQETAIEIKPNGDYTLTLVNGKITQVLRGTFVSLQRNAQK
jgi:hypothetical protein